MGPVRIKYYGVLWLTRTTYVVLQSIALLLCVAMAAVGLAAMLSAGAVFPHVPANADETEWITQGLILLFWVGLLTLLAESIETYVVLRKFARAEAEQRSQLAVLDPGGLAPPTSPHAAGVQPAPHERPNTSIQS
jgi:hypothetical protein